MHTYIYIIENQNQKCAYYVLGIVHSVFYYYLICFMHRPNGAGNIIILILHTKHQSPKTFIQLSRLSGGTKYSQSPQAHKAWYCSSLHHAPHPLMLVWFSSPSDPHPQVSYPPLFYLGNQEVCFSSSRRPYSRVYLQHFSRAGCPQKQDTARSFLPKVDQGLVSSYVELRGHWLGQQFKPASNITEGAGGSSSSSAQFVFFSQGL